MKLDPRLIARLEAQAKEAGQDPNAMLAIALGVCPTCGQTMPSKAKAVPNGRAPTRPKAPQGDTARRIIEYLDRDSERGNQSRCAASLGIKASYVNRVWRAHQQRLEHGGKSPHGGERE